MFRFERLLFALVLAATLLAPSLTAIGQQATPTAGSGTYIDPAGRFSVPIPTNWRLETRGDVAVLHDPDDLIEVYLLVVEAASIADAAPLALDQVDPPFLLAELPDATQPVPSADGVDETAVITYASTDQTEFVQVYGQRVGGSVYCVIFSGSFEAASKRNSQIQVIGSGFKISSVSEVDLSEIVPADLSPALLVEFEAYVSDLMDRLGVPGASVAIVKDGKVAYSQGFGVKELGSTEPVTADTRMMIGSTTKSMTTMMMATEVDDGLMTWDEPVVDILPQFAVADPELTKTITVRNLVCACTGVPRRDLEFLFNANDLSAEDVIASLKDFQFYTGFGEAFQYSNQMVATGGYVAAAAAGGEYGQLFDSYLEAMQARVFDPIGMADTTFDFDAVKESGDYSMPHGAALDGSYVPIPLDLEKVLVPVAPAGLVWSTANDMARYLITDMNGGVGPDGNRVVSAANLGETWVPQVAVDAETEYGLGWFLEERGGLRLRFHGGNTFGFTSDLAYLPDKGVGIVVLANAQAANLFTEGVRFRLMELLFDQPANYDKQIDFVLDQVRTARDATAAQIADVSPEIADQAAGQYVSDVLGKISLTTVGDELVLETGEFRTKLKTQKGATADGAIALIAVDPPVAGATFVLETGVRGARSLVLNFGAESYSFAPEPVNATPVASPTG